MNASRDVAKRVHSGCRSPRFPIPRRRPRRFRTSFRGRSVFSFPVVQRTAARFARSVATRHKASCRFFSPPLVVPARRRFSTKRRFIPPGERARVLVSPRRARGHSARRGASDERPGVGDVPRDDRRNLPRRARPSPRGSSRLGGSPASALAAALASEHLEKLAEHNILKRCRASPRCRG